MDDSTKHKECKTKLQSNSYKFKGQTRYVILAISTVALTLMVSNNLALNFTVICMKKDVTLFNNVTTSYNETSNEMFSVQERNILFSATSVGALLGTIPIAYLCSHFGFRKMFTVYGVINGIATLLTPLSVLIGTNVLIILRVLQGLSQATSLVAMGTISAEWSPIKSNGLYIAWISCHFQFGPMITMPIAGVLCETVGWWSLYYLQGIITIAIFALFYYFYRDSPRLQKNVGKEELALIEDGKNTTDLGKHAAQIVPYKEILKDVVTWGLLASMASGVFSFYFVAQFGPVYLNKLCYIALKLNVENTGAASAITFALSSIMKIVGGPISDQLVCLSDKTKVILFTSLSQLVMAVCFIALAFIPDTFPTTIQIVFTLIVAFNGLNAVGAVRGAHLATRNFCHVLMAWGGMIASVVTLLAPFLVSLIVTENTIKQWGTAFIILAIIIIVLNVFFILVIDVEPRPWTHFNCPDKINEHKNIKLNKNHTRLFKNSVLIVPAHIIHK